MNMTNNANEDILCVMVETKYAKQFKNILSSGGLLNKQFRLSPWRPDSIAIPCQYTSEKINSILNNHVCKNDDVITFNIQYIDMKKLKRSKVVSNYSKLKKYILTYLSDLDVEDFDNLITEIPTKWEKHGDLTLFPDNSFKSSFWQFLNDDFWRHIATLMESERLAKKSKIQQDGFRTPNVAMLLGNDPIVRHIDNGITYEYDVTKSMFSKGNISEKLRIASFDCSGEIVVDLFAGIGYFVLPYILKANAKKVYACEWNPAAVKMLHRNLEINNATDKCEILFGDNREVAPKGIADRVNLGLIPTSSASWKTACQSLNKHRGGVLHIHENIECKQKQDSLQTQTCECEKKLCYINKIYTGSLSEYKRSTWCKFVKTLQCQLKEYFDGNVCIDVFHIEYLKSYAPHVDNLVFDVRCTPNTIGEENK